MTPSDRSPSPAPTEPVPDPDPGRRETFRAVLAVFVVIVTLSYGLDAMLRFRWIHPYYHLLQTLLFVYVPLVPMIAGSGTLQDHGIAPVGTARALRIHLTVTCITFPLFLAGWWAYVRLTGGVPRLVLFDDPVSLAYYQLVYVAFPEEFCFRGFMQGRLDRAFGRPFRLLGADWGPGLLISSAFFALVHPLLNRPWVPGSWARLDVFIPSLLFGWLRAATGGILCPVLYHWQCNLFLFCLLH